MSGSFKHARAEVHAGDLRRWGSFGFLHPAKLGELQRGIRGHLGAAGGGQEGGAGVRLQQNLSSPPAPSNMRKRRQGLVRASQVNGAHQVAPAAP